MSSVDRYLGSLHFLLSQTVPHLKIARAQALKMGDPALVRYFERKLEEEVGHEKWAEDDIRELQRHGGGGRAHAPLPAMLELVEYLAHLAESNPRLYVVYILSNEYFTVLAGPTWIQALTQHCGVPDSALTAASKHVEADQAHAAHGFEAIDELIRDPAMASAVNGTVDRTLRLFDQFFREVVAVSN